MCISLGGLENTYVNMQTPKHTHISFSFVFRDRLALNLWFPNLLLGVSKTELLVTNTVTSGGWLVIYFIK